MNATITVTEIENGDVIDGLGLVLLPTETRPPHTGGNDMHVNVYVYDTVEREYAFRCPNRAEAESMAAYANKEANEPGRYVAGNNVHDRQPAER